MAAQFLLASMVLDEKSPINLEKLFYVTSLCTLQLLKVFLCFCFDCVLVWMTLNLPNLELFELFGCVDSHVSSILWIFSYYFFRYSFCLFFSFTLGTDIVNISLFSVVPQVPYVLFFFSLFHFSFCASDWIHLVMQSSSLLILPFACSNLLLNISCELNFIYSSIIFILLYLGVMLYLKSPCFYGKRQWEKAL